MRRPIMAVLLAGVLACGAATPAVTQSSEATPAPPSYPVDTVDFELVAPSVWRVDEPPWDCGKAYPRQPFFDGAEVSTDGRVWFLDRLRGIRELGSCPIVGPKPTFGVRDQALGPDGTLWLLNGDRLWSWDEDGWRVRLEGFNQPGRVFNQPGHLDDASGGYSYSTDCETGPCYFSVDVAPDGSVWLGGWALTAFDGTDTRDYLTGPAAIAVIGFGPDGTVWVRQDGALHVLAPSGPSTPTTTISQPTPVPFPAPAPAEAPLGSVLRSLVGVTGEVATWTGMEWIARLDPVMHEDANAIRGLEALGDAADARLDDITIATALVERTPGNYASVAALRIPGAEVFDLLDPAVAAMASQIERPTASWDRVHDRSLVRVKDAAMPGVYPITFYPTGDTLWVLQADRSIEATILQELPDQIGGPAAGFRCEVLQEPFLESFTTGDAEKDRVYLSRCVTCDQLLDLVKFARVADVGVAEAVLQEHCGRTPGATASPKPSQIAATREPPASGSEPADRRGVETVRSGFAMRFPAGWRVELADKEADVYSAEPGTAWEALHASTIDESMACTVTVGITDLAPDQWFATGIDGVSTPYWDPDDPTLLWVPMPAIQEIKSVHSTEWGRRRQEDASLGHDVLYVLQCVADDERFKQPDQAFERLMSSFEFMPAEE